MPKKIYKIKVIPNSKINKIIGESEDYLKIKLTAPAMENKANKALLIFLSDYFQIPKKKIKIISGEKNRLKKIQIEP
ncbi:MAG TPA: DUF167 domain-containing protein [Candidatus Uhrbacteria bacterium]|nr:DUF167 domain-containing protein [Candidatus Uhrbacteria bacterium]